MHDSEDSFGGFRLVDDPVQAKALECCHRHKRLSTPAAASRAKRPFVNQSIQRTRANTDPARARPTLVLATCPSGAKESRQSPGSAE